MPRKHEILTQCWINVGPAWGIVIGAKGSICKHVHYLCMYIYIGKNDGN